MDARGTAIPARGSVPGHARGAMARGRPSDLIHPAVTPDLFKFGVKGMDRAAPKGLLQTIARAKANVRAPHQRNRPNRITVLRPLPLHVVQQRATGEALTEQTPQPTAAADQTQG